MTHQHPSSHAIIDDEIDMLPYLQHVVMHYRYILYGMMIATVLSMVMVMVLPKRYQASTTFIIPSPSASGSGVSMLGMFSSMVSSTTASGVYSTYIDAIFKSHRIKEYVANTLLDLPYFQEDATVMARPYDERIGHVIATLQLSKKVVLEKNKEGNVSTLSFSSSNPTLVLPVIDAYLDALIALNDEMDIDADMLRIIPLDPAVAPKSPYFPAIKTMMLILNGLVIALVPVGLILHKVYLDWVKP